MRAYYFFMKFMRGFLAGLYCGFAALIVLAAVCVVIYSSVF